MIFSATNGTRQTTNAFRFGHCGRQVIYLLAGVFVLASNCPLALADKAPPNWDKVLEKGNHQLELGNTKEAAEFFAAKLQKYPNAAPVLFGYGKALKRTGKLSEAKVQFKAAVDADPSLADAHYELAVARESDKEYDGAMQEFQKFLDLKPDAAQRKNVPDRIRFCQEHI
jgi:tetratricopeptide (TPR) repeat protein